MGVYRCTMHVPVKYQISVTILYRYTLTLFISCYRVLLHVDISLNEFYCVLRELYMIPPATLMWMIVLIDVPVTPYICVTVRLPHP